MPIASGRPYACSSFASCGSNSLARHLPLAGLVSLLDEHGVVEVHDPRAASDRDARLATTSAIGKWKTRFPQADAQLIDYGN
jgi:hypothetical protein